jgi:hypothetical protein
MRKPHIFTSQTAKHIFFPTAALQLVSNEWSCTYINAYHVPSYFQITGVGGINRKTGNLSY